MQELVYEKKLMHWQVKRLSGIYKVKSFVAAGRKTFVTLTWVRCVVFGNGKSNYINLPVLFPGRCTSASQWPWSGPSPPPRHPSCSPSWRRACPSASSPGWDHDLCSSRGSKLCRRRTRMRPQSSWGKASVLTTNRNRTSGISDMRDLTIGKSFSILYNLKTDWPTT